MKVETCGVPIKSFAGLKAKMYTYMTKDEHEYKKIKGIYNSVVEDELKHESCKNAFFNATHMNHIMNRISSKNHNIRTWN